MSPNKLRNAFRIAALILVTAPAFPVIKQHYGGNVKIAEDLASHLLEIRLFETIEEDSVQPLHPLPFIMEENRLSVDLSSLPPHRISEIENAIHDLQETQHACHWLLDYPYFDHHRHNSLRVEKNQLVLSATEPELLPALARSSCLIPDQLRFLMPFLRTQFGYEANQDYIGGRPFLDSLSPVAIDPLNPYLAFKLNEIDSFLIPEEKFRQIVTDDQIQLIPGPEFYLFLKTNGMNAVEAANLGSAIDAGEIARAVLNDHAEIYLEKRSFSAEVGKNTIYLKIPDASPFRLIGERLSIQLENRGFRIDMQTAPPSAPLLQLGMYEVQEPDLDLLRYQLLKTEFTINDASSWYEVWDELEAAGRIVPLLLYQSRIAVRKNLIGVRTGAGGMPDFSNAWILPPP